jgi:hypothetical protein
VPKATETKTKTKAKKATKSTRKSGTNALNDGPLSQDEIEALSKSFHRVLRNKKVAQPVRIQLAAADGRRCLVWRCRTLENGHEKCGWVQEPC